MASLKSTLSAELLWLWNWNDLSYGFNIFIFRFIYIVHARGRVHLLPLVKITIYLNI